MLRAMFKDQIALGMAQAGVVAIVALAIALVARRRGIHLLGETAVSLGRGIAQIIVVGLILAAMLRGPWWTSPFLLAGMIVAAGATSARRASKVPGALRVSLYAIGLGAGSVIALRSTNHDPSRKCSIAAAASCSASRVFPMPPGPAIVTSLCSCTKC